MRLVRFSKWIVRSRGVLAAVAVCGLGVAGVAGAASTRSAVAPSNSSLPTITGKAAVGSTVTANPGTWTGSTPITYQYQWLICGNDGGACRNIPGATSQTYTFAPADLGNTARVTVIAGNADGTSSGNASVGSTLTASPGTWTGSGTISYKFQWRVCSPDGSACRDIPGATGQTYKLTPDDLGNAERVVVTATDANGSSSATSPPTPSIAPAPSGCPKLAAGAQSVSVNDVASPARLQIDRFRLVTSSPITAAMTSFSVLIHVSDTCGQSVSGALVYATAVPYGQVSIPAETATDAAGNVTLTFNRETGFPAKYNQQLMVLFLRARRASDPLLGGISTRRLISLPVRLHG